MPANHGLVFYMPRDMAGVVPALQSSFVGGVAAAMLVVPSGFAAIEHWPWTSGNLIVEGLEVDSGVPGVIEAYDVFKVGVGAIDSQMLADILRGTGMPSLCMMGDCTPTQAGDLLQALWAAMPAVRLSQELKSRRRSDLEMIALPDCCNVIVAMNVGLPPEVVVLSPRGQSQLIENLRVSIRNELGVVTTSW